MVTISGEEFRTGDMKPLSDSGNPQPGLINVEYLCSCQEFPYPLFHSCKILGTLPNCIHQCPGADETSEYIPNRFTNPITGNELVDTKIHHECFQVPAILDGILHIIRKMAPVDLPAVRALFVLGLVFGNEYLELGIVDLSPFYLDRFCFFQ
jgi:hypothetical protein